jgi:NADPH:quinone reductase-like Zn-dependent oxidoreductase
MVGSEIKAPWFTMTTGIKVVGGTPEKPPNAFEDLVDLIESKRLHPVLDRCYPMEDIVEAHRYVDTGRKRGNVAITID